MARAKIVNGVWTRNVPWKRKGQWRTDIFKRTLSRPSLLECRFVLKDGPTVQIPATELRHVLEGGHDHYDAKIWGPFNIDPVQHTGEGRNVRMSIL